MDRHPISNTDDELPPDAPEDVAILYSWANLQGARYRDFSANRREYRAQVRLRAAEQDRMAELTRKAQVEVAAPQPIVETVAIELEPQTRPANLFSSAAPPVVADTIEAQQDMKVLLREAAQQARDVAAERLEAARRAEAAALADSIARREERILAEEQASELRRAAQYADADFRSRHAKREQPQTAFSEIVTKLHQAATPSVASAPSVIDLVSTTFRQHRASLERDIEQASHTLEANGAKPATERAPIPAVRSEAKPEVAVPQVTKAPLRPGDPIPSIPYRDFHKAKGPTTRPEVVHRIRTVRREDYDVPGDDFTFWDATNEMTPDADLRMSDLRQSRLQTIPVSEAASSSNQTSTRYRPSGARPAVPESSDWIRNGHVKQRTDADLVQELHEPMKSPWVALKGIFESADRGHPPAREETSGKQITAIFSLAGGVGRSSLVATIGRALSSLQERVLLVDTTPHGVLPFHFGTTEVLPGVLRTFLPPPTGNAEPVDLISYSLHQQDDAREQAMLIEDILLKSRRSNRILLDLNERSEWLLGRLARFKPTVLVPLLADMNSVISLKAVEAIFNAMQDDAGEPVRPRYLLNQFDDALPLHHDMREMLKERLGARLLPFVIRRAQAVGEALAAGMTVVDYEPDSSVAQDYLAIANWMHEVAPPAEVGNRSPRWSER